MVEWVFLSSYMQPKVFPLSCDAPVPHIHVIAGTQELEAFQHTSHSFPSPSKTLPGQWFWRRDLTPVPSVILASADGKTAAHVKWGEAEGKVLLCRGKKAGQLVLKDLGALGACYLSVCLIYANSSHTEGIKSSKLSMF